MSNSAPTANVSPAIFGSLRNGLDAMKVVVVNGGKSNEPAAESSNNSSKDWANRARKSLGESMRKVYAKLPEITADPESGEAVPASSSSASPGDGQSKSWADRAKSSAKKASQSVANAAQKIKQDGLVEAAKGAGDKMKEGIGRASEGAAKTGMKIQEKTALISEKAGAKAAEAKNVASKGIHVVGEKAGGIAGSAKNKLSKTGESMKNMSLAASPQKLAQVGCVFFLGVAMISASFAFLPMVAVAPLGFACLITMGSICIMGSIALLKGPESFAKALVKKGKLPFSALYITGLLGTLYAALIKHSLVLTAIFGVMQALGILYFLASYVPGGKVCLNQIGRMCRKTVEKCAKWMSG